MISQPREDEAERAVLCFMNEIFRRPTMCASDSCKCPSITIDINISGGATLIKDLHERFQGQLPKRVVWLTIDLLDSPKILVIDIDLRQRSCQRLDETILYPSLVAKGP